MDITRRLLLGGIGAVLAAPPIVRASSIMNVKAEFPQSWLFKAYEHTHPGSWGVPQSGWVLDNGLPLKGRPDQVWTWNQFLKQLQRPDPHPSLVGVRYMSWPYNKALAFDVAPDFGQPNWVGWYDPTRHRGA